MPTIQDRDRLLHEQQTGASHHAGPRFELNENCYFESVLSTINLVGMPFGRLIHIFASYGWELDHINNREVDRSKRNERRHAILIATLTGGLCTITGNEVWDTNENTKMMTQRENSRTRETEQLGAKTERYCTNMLQTND